MKIFDKANIAQKSPTGVKNNGYIFEVLYNFILYQNSK